MGTQFTTNTLQFHMIFLTSLAENINYLYFYMKKQVIELVQGDSASAR